VASIRLPYQPKKPVELFDCLICNYAFQSQMKNAHMKSKKHLANAAKAQQVEEQAMTLTRTNPTDNESLKFEQVDWLERLQLLYSGETRIFIMIEHAINAIHPPQPLV